MTTARRLSALILGISMIAACGGGGDNDTPEVASLDSATTADTEADVTATTTEPLDPDEAMLAYTECMREHGIDMPDPQPAGPGGERGAIALEVDPSTEEFEAAQTACEPIMEDAFGEIEVDPEREAEMREQLLAFTECMREHGIDIPDPVFGEGGRVEIAAGDGGEAMPEQKPDSEEFQAAEEACGRRRRLHDRVRDDGLRMKSWVAAGAIVAVVGATAATGLVVAGTDDEPPATTTDPTTESSDSQLVEVVQRDLARTEELDGTIGHGDSSELVLAATGTLTALPAAGTVVSQGASVVEVDGAPVIVIEGSFPFWRTLGPGVEDGKDVLQLEYVLAALGYAEEHDMTVDDEWTSATTDAVEAFQTDHGQDDDGTIDLGEVVVIPGPTRVDAVTGVVGQGAAEAGITVTAPERSVSVDLPVEDADLLAVGDEVEVELPTGEVRRGRVTAIGAAEAGDAESGDSASLPVTVVLDADDGTLADGTPVEVHVDVVAAEGVLAVPVEAVLALAEGGYAVEVDDGAATRRLVAVELGVFADGMVEVGVGELAAGDPDRPSP